MKSHTGAGNRTGIDENTGAGIHAGAGAHTGAGNHAVAWIRTQECVVWWSPQPAVPCKNKDRSSAAAR